MVASKDFYTIVQGSTLALCNSTQIISLEDVFPDQSYSFLKAVNTSLIHHLQTYLNYAMCCSSLLNCKCLDQILTQLYAHFRLPT